MKRGEVWRYQPVINRPGQPTLRLIVSTDAVNTTLDMPIVLAVQVVDTDPGSVLAVKVGEHGWARALSVEPVTRGRLSERVGVAPPDAMEAVGTALRVSMDL